MEFSYPSMGLSRRSLLQAGGVVAGLGAVGTYAYGELAGSASPAEVTALVAGSLLHVCESVPGAAVEAHGSAAIRRLVVEGLRDPDAVALADLRLFSGISERATLFATNALVLTYDAESRHADDLRDDWQSAVQSEGIRLGRTDPKRDPLGYRTVMALELAEAAYGIDAEAVLTNSTVFPETDLMNVVEGGALDAAFTYRNMAIERDLPYVDLPARIDFSDPHRADTYATVSYELDHTTVRGTPIRYGATAATPSGGPWVERLVTDRERLVASGFVVPEDYPRLDVRLPVGGDTPDE